MKHVVVVFLAIVLTWPAWNALRHGDMISGHDSEAARFRAIEFKQAYLDGHFPVRWSKRLIYGLGMPVFTFAYNLPFYAATALGLLGMTEMTALKFLMLISFPVSVLAVYVWLRRYFGDVVAFGSGVLYSLAPYHFLNVYVRFAIGEVVAGMLVPFGFWAMDKYLNIRSSKSAALVGVVLAGILLAHQFYALIYFPILAVYALLKTGRLKKALISGLVFAWAIALTAYFWLPVFAYTDMTHLDRPSEFFWGKQGSFVTLGQLVDPQWGLGDKLLQNGEWLMSFQVGVVHLIFLVIGMVLMLFKKEKSRVMWGVVALSVLTVFMMLEVSAGVWRTLPFLTALQFPWRLLTVLNLTSAVMGGYVLWRLFKRKNLQILSVLVLIVVLLVLTKPMSKVGRYYVWVDWSQVAIGWPGTLTMLLEMTPKWHVIQQESNPYHQSQVAVGRAQIEALEWRANYHKFKVMAETEAVIVDKTHYWPGWTAYVNGKPVKVFDPYSDEAAGQLAIPVPKGESIVETRLLESDWGRVGNAISLVAIAGVAACLRRKR